MTSPVRAPRPAPRRAAAPIVAPERSRRPDLRVVGEPRRRTRTKVAVVLAGLVLFGSLLASAVLYSVLVSGQARLDHLDKTITSEQGNLQRSQLALADSQSPARIAEAARALGMVPALDQNWLSLSGNTPLVVTGPLTPTSPAGGSPAKSTSRSTSTSTTKSTAGSTTVGTTVPSTSGGPTTGPSGAGVAR